MAPHMKWAMISRVIATAGWMLGVAFSYFYLFFSCLMDMEFGTAKLIIALVFL